MIVTNLGHDGYQVKEVCPRKFVSTLAKYLKDNKVIQPPQKFDLVKTGCLREMPPCEPDWMYQRAASIARQVYLHPGITTAVLRNKYGGSENNGTAPRHHQKASGNIIRNCLQQLQKAKWIEYNDEKRGRRITATGEKILNEIANQVGHQ